MTSLISRHYIFYNNVTSVTVIVQQFLVLDIIFFGQCEFLCVSEDNLFDFQLANHKVFYLVNFNLLNARNTLLSFVQELLCKPLIHDLNIQQTH